MKKLIVPIVILFAVFASLIVNESILSNDNSASMALPYFNVRVMQVGGTSPQIGAEVVYKIGSSVITTGTTDGNGWCYKNLGTGTYDVYVYYPARPNDGQSGSSLNIVHTGDDYITITLGPNY